MVQQSGGAPSAGHRMSSRLATRKTSKVGFFRLIQPRQEVSVLSLVPAEGRVESQFAALTRGFSPSVPPLRGETVHMYDDDDAAG